MQEGGGAVTVLHLMFFLITTDKKTTEARWSKPLHLQYYIIIICYEHILYIYIYIYNIYYLVSAALV